MSTSPHDFAGVRAELDLPPVAQTASFPPEVVAEAEAIAAGDRPEVEDATAIPFVTIDPPGARDLDQAMFLERDGDGFRVHYAITDLGSAIPPGGAVDAEARRRGQTIYLPDGRVPLHPPVLSEDALSLLADQVRGAAVWTIDVAADGALSNVSVRRARVKSVAQLDYEGVQQSFDAGTPHPSLEPLADLGRLRQSVRVDRGAIELALPEQEVERADDEWRVVMRVRTQVDGWNAEISLLTGMAAAQLMLDAEVGLLRTLPPADDKAEADFLRTARTLKVAVPDGATPAHVLVGLDPSRPASIALMTEATRLLRGAGYEAFDGSRPAQVDHAGVGGPYAHVTAPLRRLADRFGTEVCLAICEQRPVPDWVREALPSLPDIMKESDRRAAKADRTCIDQAEVWALAGRVGESFDAVVMHADRDGGEVAVLEPPVIARCRGAGLPEGAQVSVRLSEVDEVRREVQFTFGGPAG
ncbi:RNB domain-containing ribonuclease [Aeromicrobium ginsengisoli]|uniref:RNB domain-containing ribonuclease n=1 Tax=Aeromicrobium ginsengisoli TaxID=363867 RepID=A0A5M4FDG4_9ACTN|nr:RNB domain-containing ribonuclease [Aeromicrobium ginsengisoli]KAA1397385.1 RNB domain-containing ribonuclease [Aeromicrobium ginsengisoli]